MAGLPMRPGFSLLAVLNLGEAIARLQGFVARRDGDSALRQVLSDALLRLRQMREDPAGIAKDLEGQAHALADAEAAAILRDLAAGLRASRRLLTFVAYPSEGEPPAR
ncbi:hypothetical protein KSF81_21750 [Siccirubricoccus sp. G192]|nr:hypothetical protein [Siccirubricoccus sp. G192]